MGCSLANEIDTDSFLKVFDKQLTFRQLYAFLKCRKELVFNRDIPQSSCLCEICENILLLSKEITSFAKIVLTNNVQSLIEDFSCNAQSTECMHSTCVNCSDLELNMDNFHNNKESINFHQWIRVDNKIQKSEIELPSDEICQKFKKDIKVLKKHIYVKRQQHLYYKKLSISCGKSIIYHQKLPYTFGVRGQFRSRYVFALLSQIDSKVEVNWYFIKRHHSKGPIDGMGGTIKNKVYRDVMSNKCLIKNAKDFLEYANKNINDITSICMPINELLTEPDNIENAPKIPETLSFDKVTRSSMKIIFVLLNCFVGLITMIHFLHSSTGKMTTQRFCGHENLPLLFDINQTFAFCKAKYVSR